MVDLENKRKIISAGEVDVLDISKYSQGRIFYGIAADVFDGTGRKVGRHLLLKDIVSSEQDVEEFVEKFKAHLKGIQKIQSEDGGHLEDIQLFNLSIEEAVQKGFLPKVVVLNIPE